MRRANLPKTVEFFITLLACVFLLAFSTLILTGVGYVVLLVITNMRSW